MSSRTTRASPKRRDAWLMEATTVTGASAFRHSDMMATGGATAARAGRRGGVSRGRASRLGVLFPGAAVDVALTDGKGTWALKKMKLGMTEHLMGLRRGTVNRASSP